MADVQIPREAVDSAHVHDEDCMCVMVPMEVEGARECFYCGTGSRSGPCGFRCDVALDEFLRAQT